MKNIFIGLLLLALALPVYGEQSSGGGESSTLNGQAGSYYLSRANHTGTQADSTLDTISTAGKVSGNTITSGTIAGSTAINTTGVGTLDAVLANRVSGTLLTSQNWNIIDTSVNKVNVGTQVTGTLPDWNLATIGTPGKIDGGAVNAGTIGGAGSAVQMLTTGPITSGSLTAESFSATGRAKIGGAEYVKIWTYTHTITAGEAAGDSCNITITAVTSTKVREVSACGYVVASSLVYGSGNSLVGNYWVHPILTTTTNCQVDFGLNWAENDVISITIIEAL